MVSLLPHSAMDTQGNSCLFHNRGTKATVGALYRLTVGWFQRARIPDDAIPASWKKAFIANELPYVLFSPQKGQKPVPLILYFGGTGEHGTNLMNQFNQRMIFEKVTSKAFQEKYPCYLYAPMLPKNSDVRCSYNFSTPMADLVCDSLFEVIRQTKFPPVDTNRIYLTGLFYGGSAAYTFQLYYRGRFAASLPAPGFITKYDVPETNPGYHWLFCNESEQAKEVYQIALKELTQTIYNRGGEHRVSMFPNQGHNAWDLTWQEDSAWAWLFSNSLNPKHPLPKGEVPLLFTNAICTATQPVAKYGQEPFRAADCLDATCYVSKNPFHKGDSWQIELASPFQGTIQVKTGYRDGTHLARSTIIEVSADRMRWTSVGRISHQEGSLRIALQKPIRFLRVVSDSDKGEILVLREVFFFE